MRNSGGSTDNIGHTTKKYGSNQSHHGVHWRSPASTSPLRGEDVIDAEFEQIDHQGRAIPSRGSANSLQGSQIHCKQVDFEDGQSARYRGLDMFAGKSLSLDRRTTLPIFGLAAVIAVFSLGGFWFAGGHAIILTPEGKQMPSSSVLPDVPTDSMVAGDARFVRRNVENQSLSVPVASTANAAAGHRTEGSLIYVRAPKKRRASSPARDHKDLTISLAGGSGGR